MSERLEEISKELILNKKQIDAPRLLTVTPKFFEDIEWLINRVEELEKKLSINTNNMKQLQKQNERYKQALEYIQRAIYTQHCTKNYKWNTEFEKGKISGLIQASSIVGKAIERMEEGK